MFQVEQGILVRNERSGMIHARKTQSDFTRRYDVRSTVCGYIYHANVDMVARGGRFLETAGDLAGVTCEACRRSLVVREVD